MFPIVSFEIRIRMPGELLGFNFRDDLRVENFHCVFH